MESRGQAALGPRWIDAVAMRAGKRTIRMTAAVGSTQSGRPTVVESISNVSKRSHTKIRYPTTTCQRDRRCSSPINVLSAMQSHPFRNELASYTPRPIRPSSHLNYLWHRFAPARRAPGAGTSSPDLPQDLFQPGLGHPDTRLQLLVGVRPQLDELGVVVDRAGQIAPLVVKLAEPFERASQ